MSQRPSSISTGWVTRIRDQHKRRGTWVSLGIHHLAAAPIVQLADRTGESESLERRLAFDAARFIPVGGPPEASSRAGAGADERRRKASHSTHCWIFKSNRLLLLP